MRLTHFTSAGSRRRYNRVAVECDSGCGARCPDVGSRGLNDTRANARAEMAAQDHAASASGWTYTPCRTVTFNDGRYVVVSAVALCPECSNPDASDPAS